MNQETANYIMQRMSKYLDNSQMAKIAELDKNERYYHRTDEQLAQFAGWRPTFEKA